MPPDCTALKHAIHRPRLTSAAASSPFAARIQQRQSPDLMIRLCEDSVGLVGFDYPRCFRLRYELRSRRLGVHFAQNHRSIRKQERIRDCGAKNRIVLMSDYALFHGEPTNLLPTCSLADLVFASRND